MSTRWLNSVTDPQDLDPDDVTAERLIEQLRKGLPPTGYARHFTVGRQDELHALDEVLNQGEVQGSTLIRAGYGGGKTHLLNLVHDLALNHGYVVSNVTVNAQAGVRFNRMETVLTAVCRGLELPDGSRGLINLMRSYGDADTRPLDPDVLADRDDLDGDGTWRTPAHLRSMAMWAALRAVVVEEDDDLNDLVQAWLTAAEPSRIRATRLVSELVIAPRLNVPAYRYELNLAFCLKADQGCHAWDALDDLATISRMCGYRGLVLLFDEFEDVIQNLRNSHLETQALGNLFRFFDGEVAALSYFAVTPDFVAKARDLLLRKGIWAFDFSRLDELPHFELSPLDLDDFLQLVAKVMLVHSRAYDWDPLNALDWSDVGTFLRTKWQPHSPDRMRATSKALIELLDASLDDQAA